jgi:hypothetical protein
VLSGYPRPRSDKRKLALEIGSGVARIVCQDFSPGAGVDLPGPFRVAPLWRPDRRFARVRMLLLIMNLMIYHAGRPIIRLIAS